MTDSARAPLSRRPFALQTNRISYIVAGGALLRRFLGDDPDSGQGHPPSQMWIASTVTSSLGSETEGLSRLTEEDGGQCLKTRLDSDPEAFLGAEHAERWGGNPGFLVKILNSRDRLLVQVHPDREKARKYFGSEYGKTEAWYVIDAEEDALVYAGFRPGVTRESLREAILEADSDRILGLLHPFPVRSGDILFIPAGLPHALGKGSLIIEIQEPTDITLRAERRRPSGEILPERFLHAGRGMDALLECFDYSCADFDTARKRIFLESEVLRRDASVLEESLVSKTTTPYFGMNSISLGPGAVYRKRNDRFAVGIVIAGGGLVRGQGFCFSLRRGEEIFIPYGVGDYEYEASAEGEEGAAMKVIECYPPVPERASPGVPI